MRNNTLAMLTTAIMLLTTTVRAEDSKPLFNDIHFHLTNYIQEGITAERYLEIAGERVGRTAIFGIPLQQKWDAFVSGQRAPDYYLRSDASLYYYSFVDAAIARAYQDLPPTEQARLDPMITGFNPTDMYAADHIKRVLKTFPGVFAGIGEFSVHKEFVSSKITGHTASLINPALGRLFDAVEEIGLVAILHCDVDVVRPGDRPVHFDGILRLFRSHPDAAVVWAHTGLGRFVGPSPMHLELLEELLSDTQYDHVTMDISWDEVAKYVVADEASVKAWAAIMERYPSRFIFGTDSVAPSEWSKYAATYETYTPLLSALSEETRRAVLLDNYERVFNEAIPKVRRWERTQHENGT